MNRRGITILLVVVILSALLSIGLGIFNIFFTQFIISGDIADSFTALYAADRSIESFLYRDRVDDAFGAVNCDPGPDPQNPDPAYDVNNCTKSTDNGTDKEYGCSDTKIYRVAGTVRMVGIGQYRCGTSRFVRRGFEVNY